MARLLERAGFGTVAQVLEYVGANWVGILFLLLISFFAMDVVSGFGYLLPQWKIALRVTALCIAAALSIVSFVQAFRAPVVTNHEVRMPGLPQAADGTVVVVASDMHLGTMIRKGWAERRAAQFASLNPDLIILAGDIFEAPHSKHESWLPMLQQIRAPKGVFVVTGNHEMYAVPGPIVELYGRAGFRVLHDENIEALPGLNIAGVDDISFRRGNKEAAKTAVDRALAGRAPGATIFLTHTPVYAQRAARDGANLMLSGHTHEGQIWPFVYIVRLVFPLLNGRYDVDGMSVIVGRGTGTWGPRMRLWKRSELLRIVLRSA